MDFSFTISLFLLLLHLHLPTALTDSNSDQQTLISIKTKLQDPKHALTTWSDRIPYCSWYGIECNDTKITSLSLTGLGLTGKIPLEISNISSLLTLDLSNNSFHGQIPPEFSRLVSLKRLDLSQNHLQGSIPEALSQNLDLELINLHNNRISGVIPGQMMGLKKIRVLDLSSNCISGSIPSSISNLSELTNLSISGNRLNGEIPREIGNLKKLQQIQLALNNLTGEIPDSLYNLSSLSSLSLTQNSLTGVLKEDLGGLVSLTSLSLASNRFQGKIPDSMSNLTEMTLLDLSGNLFSGSIPLFGKMKNLGELDLSQNLLSSDTVQNLRLFGSLTNCSKLRKVRMFMNELSGDLPDSIGNLSINLQDFCINDNKLTGRLPPGIQRLGNMISLSLGNNLLTGEIPASIGGLTALQNLLIGHNLFTGEIPDVFGNFSQLTYLRLDHNQLVGRIPPSLGSCQMLNALNLSRNMLTGRIPAVIFGLANLIDLSIAGNSLTGPVPKEIRSLKQVLFIDLSDNQLSGNISSSTGSCSNLKFIKMSRNRFFGTIPESFGNLLSLEMLDFSDNNLSGKIPKSLEKLKDLKILNLSFNGFEGEIPTEGVFKNTTGVSLLGNNLLCSTNPETSRILNLTRCVTRNGKTNSKLTFIISGSSVGIFLFATLGVLWILSARTKKKILFSPVVKGLPQLVTYNDIRIATDDFSDENLIGNGGSGFVYRALFRNKVTEEETVLAVKVLNLQHKRASKCFERECEAMRNTRHRNLVKIITSCSSIDQDGDEFKALVMEFMPNGSLDRLLYHKTDLEACYVLSFEQRLNILIDVASALDYMHNDCNPPIVHCDLKPGNVLLDEDMTAHVADFGLARILFRNQSQESTTVVKGSIGYIPPEYGFREKASTSGDVYSFGIFLLEMFLDKKPTDEIFKEGQNKNIVTLAATSNNVSEIVDPRLFEDNRSSSPSTSTSKSSDYNSSSSSSGSEESYFWRNKNEECVAASVKLGLVCASESPNDRPNISEALAKLMEIRTRFLGWSEL